MCRPGDSPSERGSSDYDIRHTFSGAVSYNIPAPGSGIWKSIFGNWSTDSIIYARTAPPVNVVTGLDPFGTEVLSGAYSVAASESGFRSAALDRKSERSRRKGNQSRRHSRYPPGRCKEIWDEMPCADSALREVDLTLRRQFKLRERLALQARADLFNIFNHPNFGPPINYMSSPLFGQSTQMLGASLGSGGQNGGLNPLYQIGGPRSVQLALKLLF